MKCGWQSSFLLVEQNNIAPETLSALFFGEKHSAQAHYCTHRDMQHVKFWY